MNQEILTNFIFPFLVGIISSIIATFIYTKLKKQMDGSTLLEIEGSWGEFIPKSEDRQFTFGHIYYNKDMKIYSFDGTNFKNSGEAYCYFQTVASYIDKVNKKFFYTFSAQLDGNSDKLYYGFGVINLILSDKNTLIPVDGHYTSSNIDSESMDHSMQRINIPYSKSKDGSLIIDIISTH